MFRLLQQWINVLRGRPIKIRYYDGTVVYMSEEDAIKEAERIKELARNLKKNLPFVTTI